MSHYCTSGDVTIASDAAIAAGTVLMADANSAIVVASGACIGLGAVLHAHGGSITIESGASVGAGVLLVGSCRVGTQACVGTSTTIHNANVAPGQLIPPGSLIGQAGRQGSQASTGGVAQEMAQGNGIPDVGQATNKRNSSGETAPPKTVTMEPEPSPWDLPDVDVGGPSANGTSESASPPSGRQNSDRSANRPVQSPPNKVYGKEQFERIRGTVSS